MKKKALVFLGYQDYMNLNQAFEYHLRGYQIYLVGCDSSARICHDNFGASKAKCRFCHYIMRNKVAPFLKRYDWSYISLSDLITKKMIDNARSIHFDYNNVQELKNIKYKGVDIGYGAYSSFVTYTRNIMPTFNDYFKEYIDLSLACQISETDAFFQYIDNIKPEIIVLFNGRTSFVKPLCCIAMNSGLNYIVTERMAKGDVVLQNDFYNTIPHSYSSLTRKIDENWNRAGNEKENIGKLFFENRKNSKPAGDKVYTINQRKGQLPEGFDVTKRNITIFNSSEDEYCAIGKDFDDECLFTNQYTALQTIFDHYKNDSSVHFYLRIHPNLAKVPYKNHTLLYDLKYENVTIIPPLDSVSSYTLMEKSEKVIVFLSTMGLESSYWGKPVIALNRTEYSDQNIVYLPKSEEELYKLIDDKALKNIQQPKENWYKIAVFYMGYGFTQHKFFPTYKKHMKILFNKEITYSTGFSLFGSEKLQAFVDYLLNVFSSRGICARFNGRYMKKTM